MRRLFCWRRLRERCRPRNRRSPNQWRGTGLLVMGALLALLPLAWPSAAKPTDFAAGLAAQSPLAAPDSPVEPTVDAAATQAASLLALANIERPPLSDTLSGGHYSLTLVALILAGLVVVAALLVWRRE